MLNIWLDHQLWGRLSWITSRRQCDDLGRAHVSQAVRGFPGMSLVANYLRQTENKTGFWAVQISLLFLGFYDRQQVGNVQVKGVCTLLISFSLFLSFFPFLSSFSSQNTVHCTWPAYRALWMLLQPWYAWHRIHVYWTFRMMSHKRLFIWLHSQYSPQFYACCS